MTVPYLNAGHNVEKEKVLPSTARLNFAWMLAASLLAFPALAQEEVVDPLTDAFVLIPESPSEFFVDATATNVPTAPSLHATDSVFVDVNNDGHLDVVVSVEYGVNRLYLNDGTGKLTYMPSTFGDTIRDSEHVRTADFDGDGNMDVVFVAESDEVHQLWFGDGKGGFTDVSDRIPVRSQGNALAVGDVNGDGLPDIVIGSTGERGHGEAMELYEASNILYLNNPENPGHFIDVSATHLPQGDDQTEGLALADMTGDGTLDLVIASPAYPNRLFLNDGEGRFTDASDRLDLPVENETREVHVLDVNGDGHNDIVFFSITSNNAGFDKDPQTRLLMNDGEGNFTDETAERLPAHTFSSWAGTVVDFNNDGAPDLLVGAIQVPGFVPLQLRAWQNDGKGNFTDVTLDVVPGITTGRAWSMGTGDLDGDGRTDVMVGGWGTQARLLLTDIEAYQAAQPPLEELTPEGE
ncbi:VCBS repeat-containing protein [Aureimonas altamirensis]|uniref:FG-GAP repeat domain-containing protein n=1 Tax=Aureimonas altamirensis TaxID=370622 RepID=UPI001E572E94|nr:VCBS repeat-containing protein [Aureimonas altamirensis]UHD47712.1 VCBS repeat-containing protein [Aureimonas altamirensis]